MQLLLKAKEMAYKVGRLLSRILSAEEVNSNEE